MWIKICGIRDVATARAVAALSPDAIGLNFYEKSARCATRAVAREIAATLPQSIQAVGVFVNHEAAEIVDIVAECGLTMIQLHGDERPEYLAGLQSHLPKTPLIRAWRISGDLTPLAEYLAECKQLNVRLFGCLIDANVAGTYGGTGHSPPWEAIRREYSTTTWPKLILAGGLTPENVAAGITAVEPRGVDVASGVESSPGVKDLDRVAKFIANARSA